MPCYHPMTAWQNPLSKKMVFEWSNNMTTWEQFQLPCGQCIGCRLEKSRKWAMRCMHESSLHEDNIFLTLTYRPEELPFTICSKPQPTLYKPHFQKFMKRLRKKYDYRISYYMCGEYGDDTNRPHYHAILFGHDFKDKKPHKRSKSGEMLYTSDEADQIWSHGFVTIGDVSFESAAYVARYVLKKRTGKGADFHYQGREPEYASMSLKPAIGKNWLEKWKTDVYPHDYVIINGKKVKPPRYYDNLLTDPELEAIKEKRKENAPDLHSDRLAAGDYIQHQKQLRRNQL
jgi:uracil-DNA glycosylase